MTTRELTCIVCPRGCQMTVELGDEITVKGNACPRGETYAQNECTNPQRTVTSTMLCDDGSVLAVKTDSTIPKADVMNCMKVINSHIVKLPVKIGDVLISDVFGANVVATENRS